MAVRYGWTWLKRQTVPVVALTVNLLAAMGAMLVYTLLLLRRYSQMGA